MGRALLFLDVDGVLNPYADPVAGERGYQSHRLQGFNVWLNPQHGPMLLAFAEQQDLELVWATTWEDAANVWIGPHIGLPELPVVALPRRFSGAFTADHWKFDGVLEYADGRPLAWFDDDFHVFDADQDWFLQQRAGAPTLLHSIWPKVGLTATDLEEVAAWLRT